MTQRLKLCVVGAFSLALLTTACDKQSQQDLATGLGAAGGGVAGYFIGDAVAGTTGGVIGAALGAVAGGVIGGQIGRYLTEEDREQAATATAVALNDAEQNKPKKPVKWTSTTDTGASGEATVVNKPQTTAECYDVREVAYVPGQGEVEQTQRYCKGEQGWVVA